MKRSNMILIIESIIIDDKTGRRILIYTPRLYPDILAEGFLTFAQFSAWEDEPETHIKIRTKCIESAKNSLKTICKEALAIS